MRTDEQQQPLTQRLAPDPQPVQRFSISYNSLLALDHTEDVFDEAMARMYGLIALGIAITGAGVWAGDQLGVDETIAGFGWPGIAGMIGITLALVLTAAAVAEKGNPGLGTALYLLYTCVQGMFISYIADLYSPGQIIKALLMTAGLFVGMSMIGMTTKKDLTRWGPVLLFILIGLIIVYLVNAFLMDPDELTELMLVIDVAILLVFMGLTVYDTKKMKTLMRKAAEEGEVITINSLAVIGGIYLYLNFLNMFLRILALLER